MTDVELLAADAAARERALDVGSSFLVQAPAGSGKTGLLIQRFLALLAHVDRPERIVAMTFTRKAAGEMRERIVEALAAVAADAPLADDAHARRTRDLARAALANDRRRGWQLAAHPSRLAIDTIDAIATGFARQAPVTSGFGAMPTYVDDATDLYVDAARAALARAPVDDAAWRALAAHDDNRADSIVALLADLLAKRDQWLHELAAADRAAMRAALERTLAAEIEAELGRARDVLGGHARELVRLARYAASHLDGDVAACLARCGAGPGLPGASVHRVADWCAVANWLLVKNGARLRRTMTAQQGFPGAAAHPGARAAKEAMEALLEALAADSDVAHVLDTVRHLPPATVGDATWASIDAFVSVLPGVAAELSLTFAERNRIDFVAGAIAAMRALGDADAPSDLLLRLDNRIAHLLVDEFQDTSRTQLELIERLTAGWTPGDGRTLFAVGDPMQSIYRFRAAEVSLFVEAQQRGAVANVAIENLTLRRNFRSQASLVRWVNDMFPSVLGRASDPLRSIVGFSRSTPAKPDCDADAVTFDLVASAADEARIVAARVRDALAAGDRSVAILVRTRLHAEPLLPALRAAGVEFSAVELDAFGDSALVRDLASLAHALVQPRDRLAWLAVLRAPWCGLALADLVAVSQTAASRDDNVTAAIRSPSSIASLSPDGFVRLTRLSEALIPALASRGRASVAARVRSAWLALGGAACVCTAAELDAAERFFALLAEHERAGDVGDFHAFAGALARLREGDAPADAGVRVMTLHKAKGLQFDTVIMPALARGGGKSPPQLLRWRRREAGLLIAPGTSRGGDDDPIFAYLAALASDEEAAELGRLLYVGCTRAIRRLHLTASMRAKRDANGAPCWPSPPSGSALARLSPILDGVAPPTADATERPARAPALLSRVPMGWQPSLPVAALAPPRGAEPVDEALPFDWVRETARHVGVVVHRVLAQIARDGLGAWSAERVGAMSDRLAAMLAGEGVDAADVGDALAQTREALVALLADARGRWLFDPSHEDARSEWALAGIDDGEVVHRVIDRTFVADGVRWIVDFKTGRHEGGDVQQFLDAERDRYAATLGAYARLVSALDPRPIRLALYHPRVRGWREWAFERN